MQLTLSRKELKDAVAGFTKIVPTKTTVPIFGCLKFEADGKNVIAHGTDLDQKAEYAFTDAVCDEHFSFTAGFQQLKDLSRGSDNDRIEFTAVNKEKLAVVNPVAGQTVRLELPSLDTSEWPSQVCEVKTQPVDDFLAVFQRLAPFASTDPTRYMLNSCFLDISEKGEGKGRMVATDGRRLTVRNTMTIPLNDSCIVPTTRFLNWIKGTSQIGAAKQGDVQWFAVETGQWKYFVRSVAGTYPNYRQVIPSDTGKNRITFTDEDVISLVQILKAFPGDSKGTIALRAGDGGALTVACKGSDDVKETSLTLSHGSTYTGKTKQIGVSRYFLKDALDAGFRMFDFADERSPLVSDDGHGAKHVLMPIGISDYPVPAQHPEPVAVPATETRKAVEQPVKVETTLVNKHPQHTDMKGERKMSKHENSAIEKLQAAYEAAKDKLREAHASLAELASLIKDALKEEKQRRSEIDNVRSSLAKIQSIKV